VGIFFGGLSAMGTHDVKRMLAYSTLGQIGFILAAIGWGSPLALVAALVFTFNHSLIKSAMLMLAGSVASRAPVKTASFSVVTGLGKAMPFTGVLFLLGGMALAGIPPTNGFISKMMIFQSGIDSGQLTSLALIALASVITLVYVGRAFMRIWMEPAAEGSKAKPSGDRLTAPAILILLCLIFGLWSEPLLRLSQATVEWISMPSNYIRFVLAAL
jgi:multicomponent Na+:H+ antiporter subunit D